MVIDAYSHCGISRFLPVDEVLAAMRESAVERAVLCQHLGEYDNSYLAEVVASDRGRFAAVCLVDADKPDANTQLRAWNATGCFRGLRILAEWLPQKPALIREAVDLGMNLILYSPEGIATSIPHIRELLHSRPHARIVLGHLGNPQIKDGRLISGTEILSLAADPGVYVQMSGLSMFCEYPHTMLNDLILETIKCFGPPRMTWGSNFPVCGDRHVYRRDLDHVRSGGWGLKPSEIEWIVGGTAQRVWFD